MKEIMNIIIILMMIMVMIDFLKKEKEMKKCQSVVI